MQFTHGTCRHYKGNHVRSVFDIQPIIDTVVCINFELKRAAIFKKTEKITRRTSRGSDAFWVPVFSYPASHTIAMLNASDIKHESIGFHDTLILLNNVLWISCRLQMNVTYIMVNHSFAVNDKPSLPSVFAID